MKKAADVFTTMKDMLNASLHLPPNTPLPAFMQEKIPFVAYFRISHLQDMEPTEENIFGDDDFKYRVEDDAAGDPDRLPTTLKMGNLLIGYCPGGKASFELDVKIIDKEAGQTRPLFHFSGERYPDFQFEDMMPFFLAYSAGATMTARDRANPMIGPANQVREIITKMARGEQVPQEHSQEVIANFFAALEAYRNQAYQHRQEVHANPAAAARGPGFFAQHEGQGQRQDHSELEQRDVKYYFRAPDSKPRNEAELAAKLTACFLSELGMTKDQMKHLVNEYLQETGKAPVTMDEAWAHTVMTALVDDDRYSLQTVLPEEVHGETLRNVIEEIKQEQLAPGP